MCIAPLMCGAMAGVTGGGGPLDGIGGPLEGGGGPDCGAGMIMDGFMTMFGGSCDM